MIVVDTSVWVDHFRGAVNPEVGELHRLLRDDLVVALTDVVYTEILQGLESDTAAERMQTVLEPFDVLRLDALADFARAAKMLRTARSAGVTIRKTLDCLIAAVCVREGVPLLHRDVDFDRLASVTELVVHRPARSG